MTIPAHLTAFWAEFSAASGNDPMDHFGEAYHFDDNQQSADELAELVLRGVKRATAGLVWSFEVGGAGHPQSWRSECGDRLVWQPHVCDRNCLGGYRAV